MPHLPPIGHVGNRGGQTMKVALYARVSSDKQDVDLSISSQIKALTEYAQRNGDEIVREFVD
jgi:site-specific DNA recombinase